MDKTTDMRDSAESREDKITRKRRRAERNKMRTIKHVHKLLDSFQSGILNGFSNEGWTELAGTYRQLSPFLATNEFLALGHIWRSTWAQEPNVESVSTLINSVKARIETQD